jgi:hypothetical protein
VTAPRDVPAVAGEVIRLFGTRGAALVDRRANPPGDGLFLRLKQPRDLRTQVGSVFYVWLTPDGEHGARVSMFGEPTLGDEEPCTQEAPALPCTPISVLPGVIDLYMNGRNEADVVQGVLAELKLEGVTTAAGV